MDFRSSPFPLHQRAARLGWQLCHAFFIRMSPRPLHGWRRFWLRLWGAKIGARCRIYPGAIVWAPWNLTCEDDACVADGAELYNPAPIRLGARAVISQGAYLCTASHDYRLAAFPLVARPIAVEADAWIAARAIVLPGCTVGEGAVIGAGSVLTRDAPAWSVSAGNPCRTVRENYRRT